MFVICNNFLYRNTGKKKDATYRLVTYNVSKTDSSFTPKNRIYYKEIPKDDENIQDIYDLQFFLEWDSGFDDVEKTWEIVLDGGCLIGNEVNILFIRGLLPGWEIIENNFCSKYVDLNKCKNFSVVYIYNVKDGKVLDKPLSVKKEVSGEEFKSIMLQHKTQNI